MSSTVDPSGRPEPAAGVGGGLASRVKGLAGGVLDLVFPPSCVSCHALVEPGPFRHLCAGCRRRIVAVSAPHCTTCGYPFFGVVGENLGCPHCEMLRPAFGEGRTATLLQGPMRRIVHALKYENALHVLHDIAALARENTYFTAFFTGAVVVPVPLHARKRRERGYNQAEMVARCFAEIGGASGVNCLLKRVIDTPTQTRLNREERQTNLKNAFAMSRAEAIDPRLRYVLVDDVFTTGATLNACATTLRRAGVSRVDIATLGHG